MTACEARAASVQASIRIAKAIIKEAVDKGERYCYLHDYRCTDYVRNHLRDKGYKVEPAQFYDYTECKQQGYQISW